MKSNKEARRSAKKLFRGCLVKGQLDENRARETASQVASKKPRYCLAILSEFEKLIRHEYKKSTLHLESASSLTEQETSEIKKKIQAHFPRPLTTTNRVNAALIGGLRIKVGSDVWDGSVAARLNQLKTSVS